MPISIKIALGIVYAVGMVIAYIISRIRTEFDNDLLGSSLGISLLWPAFLCIAILWLIGKGLDQIAYAVQDAIWRVQEKRGKGS